MYPLHKSEMERKGVSQLRQEVDEGSALGIHILDAIKTIAKFNDGDFILQHLPLSDGRRLVRIGYKRSPFYADSVVVTGENLDNTEIDLLQRYDKIGLGTTVWPTDEAKDQQEVKECTENALQNMCALIETLGMFRGDYSNQGLTLCLTLNRVLQEGGNVHHAEHKLDHIDGLLYNKDFNVSQIGPDSAVDYLTKLIEDSENQTTKSDLKSIKEEFASWLRSEIYLRPPNFKLKRHLGIPDESEQIRLVEPVLYSKIIDALLEVAQTSALKQGIPLDVVVESIDDDNEGSSFRVGLTSPDINYNILLRSVTGEKFEIGREYAKFNVESTVWYQESFEGLLDSTKVHENVQEVACELQRLLNNGKPKGSKYIYPINLELMFSIPEMYEKVNLPGSVLGSQLQTALSEVVEELGFEQLVQLNVGSAESYLLGVSDPYWHKHAVIATGQGVMDTEIVPSAEYDHVSVCSTQWPRSIYPVGIGGVENAVRNNLSKIARKLEDKLAPLVEENQTDSEMFITKEVKTKNG